ISVRDDAFRWSRARHGPESDFGHRFAERARAEPHEEFAAHFTELVACKTLAPPGSPTVTEHKRSWSAFLQHGEHRRVVVIEPVKRGGHRDIQETEHRTRRSR